MLLFCTLYVLLFCGAHLQAQPFVQPLSLDKNWSYPKNISAVKKREDKKVQVTEQPKDVISPWGQEESYTS